MNVVVVGLNHRSAPLWIRERVAFPSWVGAARDVAERASLAEALVLSTCNRVEVYGTAGDVDRDDACERLVALFAERAAMPTEVLRGYLYMHTGTDAARHLARVAAGIDSMVLGETQIVSQLKLAVTDARTDGVMGRLLERLVSTAFAAGKRARPLLPVISGAHSVAEAGVRALGGIAPLADASVVVVGAGHTATDLLRALAGARPRRLVLVNRTLQRALPLAAKHGAAVASWEALGVVIADADVVFSCTAVPTPVIVPEHLTDATRRERTFVDLGVPRNVAPSLAELPQTRVIDVDALGTWQTTLPAETAYAAADAMVEHWVARFGAWLRSQRLLPTITALQRDAESAAEREVARALARLGAVSERDRDVVRQLASRLVAKMLHGPLCALSSDVDAESLAAAASRLFALDTPDQASLTQRRAGREDGPTQSTDGGDDLSAFSASPRDTNSTVATN